jgi:hypothetical protein
MTASAKKLLEEIETLLTMTEGFQSKYDEEKHTVKEELFEELHFFYTRAKYIFEALKKDYEISFLRRFRISHVSLSKSQIDLFSEDIVLIRAYLKTTKRELEQGLLYKLSNLIKAEVFSNFLEYARHMLDGEYKVAAAVMIGGVMEEHLRNISTKHGLKILKADGKNLSIEPLNENLYAAGKYELLIKNRITTYATIRNNAAHLHPDKFTLNDVEEMYKFVCNIADVVQ